MEEKLKLLEFCIDSIPDAVYWITLDGRFLNVNAAACGMLGYSREELLLLSMHDIDPDYTHAEGQSDLEEQRQTGTLKLKSFHTAKDGRIIPVEITSNYFTYNDCEYICSIVRDITERKAMESELRQAYDELEKRVAARTTELAETVTALMDSEAQYRAIVDAFDGLIYICSQDYRVGFMNKKFIERTGYNAVGESCFKVIHGRDSVCPWCVNDRVFAGEMVHWETLSPKDNCWYYMVNAPVYHANGSMSKYSMIMDITERKQAEEALQKSGQMLLSVLDNFPGVVFWKDRNSVYMGCNKNFSLAAGLSEPSEIVGKNDHELPWKNDVECYLADDRQVMESGVPKLNIIETLLHADGRLAWFETSKVPLFDTNGKVFAVLGASNDITERKHAEEALRESESAVRRKLESILDPEGEIGELDLADILDAQGIQALMEDLYRLAGIKMSIIDLKGRVLVDVGWQDICLEFHRAHPETRMNCLVSDTDLTVGVPAGEFRQYRCRNNMWHIVTPIFVGGRHMGNLFMGQFFLENEELDYDLFRAQARRYGFPEEEYVAALESVPRHSEECVNMGKAVFLRLTDMFSKLSYANIKLARTLTEREQLTAKLREANLVVENSPVVLFRRTADEGCPVELVSGNVIQFGYTPEDFLSGAMTYSSIIHPDDLERVTCEVRDYCAEGVDQFRLDYRIITKGGNIRWVNEHTKVERNPEGCPTHFQGIVIDVTGRKEIEEALWQAHEELESRVKERTGQLTSLTAELSLAEERERRRIATELHDQVGQTLILSKLKLNSLKHGLPSAEFEALLGEISRHLGHSIEDIRSLTFQLSPPLLYELGFEAAVEWLADELAERNGFRVDFRDDGKKKPLNEETRVALYQMVRELIINVVKHADAKKVAISIERFADRIRVIVSDDGSGFDSEAVQRRLTGNRSFGLFNIRHRIEYLGGEFAIESEIGRGTRITLLLPVTENGVKSHAEEK